MKARRYTPVRSRANTAPAPCPPHDCIKQPDGALRCWKCGVEKKP